MKCKFIHIRIKSKSKINISNSKILELLKLSVGNKITNLNNNNNEKESSKHNLENIFYKKVVQKNITKMIYKKLRIAKK